jgi:xylulose-5-phosphate/fructose-6-phosphate phosphoketolase
MIPIYLSLPLGHSGLLWQLGNIIQRDFKTTGASVDYDDFHRVGLFLPIAFYFKLGFRQQQLANDISGTLAIMVEFPLTPAELHDIHAYWRACNYLAVGMIYLRDNPLLREPLQPQHIKRRLLGHWGTSPGLSFLYVHLNRIIKKHDQNMIYVAGPGHGAPGVLGPVYLEGTYSEVYPNSSQDLAGMRQFFKQFSFPGGIGSHCTPETPGSIHEGGELGYSLSHAYGMAFDNPDLIVACVVGDGEAETGPLATAWHSNKFLNPARDGAVLPILHLNGYKISNPSILARISTEELTQLFQGYGYHPYFVSGDQPEVMHQQLAHTLDQVMAEIKAIQTAARSHGSQTRPRWPMIVFRSPKGWTGPLTVDGQKTADFWRSHQVPLSTQLPACRVI